MKSDQLKILAEHYFYPWEINAARKDSNSVDALKNMVHGVRRCLVHSDDISYTTCTGGKVLFYLKGNSSMTEADIKTTVDELVSAVFKEESQLKLF